MNNHFTEEQFQDYLDNPDNFDKINFEGHLKICNSCQKNLEIYQELYTALNADLYPALANDFSAQLVSTLSDPQESRWQLYESGFTIVFFLFGIAASLYFVNPLPYLTNLTNNIFNNLGEYVSKFLPEINGSLPILIVAIIIFLLVEILDKKIIRSRM